jgi:hypothetical protein
MTLSAAFREGLFARRNVSRNILADYVTDADPVIPVLLMKKGGQVADLLLRQVPECGHSPARPAVVNGGTDQIPALVVVDEHGADKIRTAIASRRIGAVAEATVARKESLPAGYGGRILVGRQIRPDRMLQSRKAAGLLLSRRSRPLVFRPKSIANKRRRQDAAGDAAS